jgi:hypothetical protein
VRPFPYYDGIDFRPSDGFLYAFDSQNQRGVQYNSLFSQTPTVLSFAPPTQMNGFNWGFDFNPVVNRARFISEANQNFTAALPGGVEQPVVAPDVAFAASDPNFGVDPNIVDIAYSNNFVGASSTTLYGIDTRLDVLVTINPTTSQLTTVGPLGVDVNAAGGFDISGATGIAYAGLLPANASNSSLYRINLTTGAATLVGQVDGGIMLTGLTVAPVPEPASAALIVLGLAGIAGIRRRS